MNDLIIGVNGMGKAKQEMAAINKAESMMLTNKVVTMDKARQYVNAGVKSLRKDNIPITPMTVYNAALGQGGWSK